MLAAYCAAIQRAADADEVIAYIKVKNPGGGGLMMLHKGKAMPSPMVGIKESAERHAMMIGKALGFTPERNTSAADFQNGEIW